jgi:hypothetical protein
MNAQNPDSDFAKKIHLGQYWAPHWLRFEREMKALGLEVHECAGWNGWGGPAVTVPHEKLAEVQQATRLRLDRHRDGDNIVLYPAPVEIG